MFWSSGKSPFRRYQRSLTDTAFIFERANSTSGPTSPLSPSARSPFSRTPSTSSKCPLSPLSPPYRTIPSPQHPQTSPPTSPPPRSVPPVSPPPNLSVSRPPPPQSSPPNRPPPQAPVHDWLPLHLQSCWTVMINLSLATMTAVKSSLPQQSVLQLHSLITHGTLWVS